MAPAANQTSRYSVGENKDDGILSLFKFQDKMEVGGGGGGCNCAISVSQNIQY